MLFLTILLQASTCTTIGQTTRCTSAPAAPAGPITYDTGSGLDGDALQSLGANIRAKKARGRQKKVGKMIAAGDCQGAVAYALDKGDLALADYARSYCSR